MLHINITLLLEAELYVDSKLSSVSCFIWWIDIYQWFWFWLKVLQNESRHFDLIYSNKIICICKKKLGAFTDKDDDEGKSVDFPCIFHLSHYYYLKQKGIYLHSSTQNIIQRRKTSTCEI